MQKKEELIQKLFSKKCSKSELELLLLMIDKDRSPTPPKIMDELFKQIKESEMAKEGSFDRVWKQVTDQTTALEQKVIRPRLAWSSNRPLLRIAASVALVLASVLIFYYLQNDDWIVQQATAGQIEIIELPDGSIVTLNGNSSIKYPSDWSANPVRTVYLEGGAYFKVKNFGDGTTKFQVVTSDLTVEVLGTSFNVNSWQEETSVFLEEGQVKVRLEDSTNPEVLLEPGEIVRYSASEKKFAPPKSVATELEVSWKQGSLEFKETPLEDALYKLASPNNLSYTILSEDLSQREFTFRVPTEDLEVALKILSTVSGTKIERIGNQLVIQESTSEE